MAVLLTASACGSDYVHTGLPPTDGARSMILSVDGEAPSVFDLTQGAVSIPWPRGRLPALDAWVYAETLAGLGLSPGPLTIDADGGPLPPTEGAWHQDLAGAAGWTRASTVAGPLASVRVARADRCRRFRGGNLLIGSETSGVPSAAAYPGGRLIAVLSSFRLWLLSDESAAPLSLVGVGPAELTAVGTTPEGLIYLATADGLLARGTLTGTVVTASPIGMIARGARQLVAGPSDEVFFVSLDLMNGKSVFGHFEAGVYEALAEFPPSLTEDTRGGLVLLGPGAAIAGRVTSSQVMVYDHGALSFEQPGDGVEMISTIGRSDTGSVLVGTTRGSLIRRSATRWIRLFGFDSDEAINAISGFGDGAVFGSVAGNVGYYTSALGLCRSSITPLPNRPTSVGTTASGGWIFVGSRPFGSGPSQAGIVHLLE